MTTINNTINNTFAQTFARTLTAQHADVAQRLTLKAIEKKHAVILYADSTRRLIEFYEMKNNVLRICMYEDDYKTALQQYVDKIDELRGDTHRVVSKQ